MLPEEVVFPAEIFKDAGFRTAGIWRNGWVAPNFGFNQGFDVYVRPAIGRERANMKRHNPSAHALQGTDADLMRSAGEFLANFGSERFFLYLHMMDLHQYIFDELAEDFGPSYSDAYDKSLNWSDRLVGALVAEIDARGLLDETLIVIASDHGEAFQEHGTEGHARNLYGEVTRVPFVIAFPFRLDPGIVVTRQVSNVDIWPTILELAGMPAMEDVDGRSQVALIRDAAGEAVDVEDRPAFAHLDRWWGHPRREPRPLLAVTDGRYRLLVDTTDDEKDELYELASDPMESNNLAESQPERLAELRGRLDEYLAKTDAPWGSKPEVVELDEMQLNQLRALGYKIEQ